MDPILSSQTSILPIFSSKEALMKSFIDISTDANKADPHNGSAEYITLEQMLTNIKEEDSNSKIIVIDLQKQNEIKELAASIPWPLKIKLKISIFIYSLEE